jgi:hypothetical protein
MSLTDPRILIPLLEDLREELSRTSLEAREAVGEAARTQAYLREHVERLRLRAQAMVELAAEDARLAGELRRLVDEADQRAANCIHDCADAAGMASNVLTKAIQACNHWKSEVERARRRVRAARAWVAAARHAVDRAQARLSSAEADLNSAEYALAECRRPIVTHDREGRPHTHYRDCSAHAARVAAAAAAVARAHSELEAALAELRAAKRELADAERDLAACEAALALAREARTHAKGATAEGELACHEARCACDQVNTARSVCERTQAHAVAEARTAQAMMSLAVRAAGFLGQAEEALRLAQLCCDALEDASVRGQNDLSLRLELLRQFNLPHVLP